jgi:hypothetical protein
VDERGGVPMAGPRGSLKVIVTALIVLLVVLVGIFGYLNARGEKLEEGKIRFKAANEILGEITVEEVKQLPAVNKKMAISSTSGLTKHNFTCTPLLEVFNHIDPEIVKSYEKVITRGVDNYVSGVNMEEVLEKNNVYLVYADNGAPLKSKTGTEGTMRIVILDDLYGQRFTNYLVEIQLE